MRKDGTDAHITRNRRAGPEQPGQYCANRSIESGNSCEMQDHAAAREAKMESPGAVLHSQVMIDLRQGDAQAVQQGIVVPLVTGDLS